MISTARKGCFIKKGNLIWFIILAMIIQFIPFINVNAIDNTVEFDNHYYKYYEFV